MHHSQALADLYERHSALLRSFVIQIIHDEAEAEDLLQEIFMEVWHHAKSYCPEKGKPLGWMVTMARRRAIDRLRRRECYGRVEERFQRDLAARSAVRMKHPGMEAVESQDLHEVLADAMAALPKAQREALELAFFNGLTQREIAGRTQIPLGTVKTRLELGLRKVAEKLRGIADEL